MTRDSTADVRAFKMIPFAAKPVGDLRWKPPQPVTPWQGVRRADYFSPSCMQVPYVVPDSVLYQREEVSSEDCLYLNVWTSAKSSNDKLPVLVWIYGGANIIGSTAEPRYDGAALAKKGVIVVSANYRVGVLGFLAHPDLTKESATGASGNYGLMDQIAALKWVQKNIAAFGGDPNSVTLFGVSAGSLNVSLLTASPLAKGLFHRAIGGSGTAFVGGSATLSIVKLPAAEHAGDIWAKTNFNASTIAELRAKSAWDLAKPMPPMLAVVDGYVIPDYLENVYANGRQNDVPLLTGWAKDEGTIFGPMAWTIVRYTAVAQVRYDKFADQFLKTYPASTDAEAITQSLAMSSDIVGRGHWTWVRAHDKTGKTKSYMYYWTYEPPWLPGVKFTQMASVPNLGAYHQSEIEYVFQTLNAWAHARQYTEADTKLSDTISSYWVNFAKTGDPNGPGLPTWLPFDNTATNPVLYLGTQIQPGPLPNKPGLEFMDAFWGAQLPPMQ
jgi:para-nitrobenzyl esterase